MIWPVLAYAEAATGHDFIPPVDTMDDAKGEVVYVDREKSFFLIIERGKFYIGHPTGSRERAGSDVPYTWGDVVDCSTPQLSCVKLGNEIYIRSNENHRAAFYADRTVVSSWDRGSGLWTGSGIRCAATGDNEKCRPLMSYLYDVGADGVVSHISITFWQFGSEPQTYDLTRKSEAGITLLPPS